MKTADLVHLPVIDRVFTRTSLDVNRRCLFFVAAHTVYSCPDCILEKKPDTATWIFLIVISLWSLTEGSNFLLTYYNLTNHIVYNLNWLLSTVIIIFYNAHVGKLSRWVTVVISLIFILFALIQLLFYGSIWIWNMPVVYLASFIIICMSAYSLVRMVQDVVPDLFHQTSFWICTTLLFYFTTALMSFGLFPQALTSVAEIFNHFWTIHSVINICANLLYAYAFFLCRTSSN